MTENFPGYTFTYLPERQRCMNKNIIVIYTQSGFTLDTETTKDKQFYENAQLLTDFAKKPYRALLYYIYYFSLLSSLMKLTLNLNKIIMQKPDLINGFIRVVVTAVPLIIIKPVFDAV